MGDMRILCYIVPSILQIFMEKARQSFQDVDGQAAMVMGVILLFALASVYAARLAVAQDAPEHERNVIVVQFAPEVSISNKASASGLQEFDRRAALYGVHLIERVYPFLDHVEPTPKTRLNLMALRRTYYVRYHADADPRLVAKQFDGVPGVVYVEPVLVNRTQALATEERMDPDDPRFIEQTHLRHMLLPEAWDVVKSESKSPRVVIAIVDTGGEWRHEDLVGNVWTNPGEIPDNGVDDDNNGFIDDVHGVDFTSDDDNDPTPSSLDNTHGTASAGSASAVTDNGVGIAGPAWNAEIMHINSQALIRGYDGILYAAVNGADIINASWAGFGYHDEAYRFYDQTLDLATDMGALVVASAANSNRNNDQIAVYPAGHPRVLSVGATEKDSKVKASFSHFGKLVNVFAPGVRIPSTYRNNEYGPFGGTSASSPLTAGVAALVKTRFPEMTPDAVREHVRLTSENMDADNPGLAGQLGRGYVNALAAVQQPTLPAVRLKRWNWADSDGNSQIASGDRVTITATMVNYLVDAQQLTVGLVGAEPYPFLELTRAESFVGSLASGDSVIVRFEFTVATDAPANQWVRVYTRVREGVHADEPDMINFRINYELDTVHESLSALYRATDGDSWNRNTGWDITNVPTEEELHFWSGVFLFNGFLTDLQLDRNNLTGELPAELGSLVHLQGLRLFGNSLSGEIPPELGNLEQLVYLGLHRNSLSGSIPPELGDLGQLRELSLVSNSLSGEIPSELGNLGQLQELQLSSNSLSGEIPPEFGNLEQLRSLRLSENSISGEIPSELGDLSQLQRLDFRENSLSGPIPPELGNLGQLRSLSLSGNALFGEIPLKLGNLEQLEGLSLHNNSFSGSIPPELGNLEQLQWLVLSGNSLSGPIPPELGNLGQLKELALSGNSLSGPIPPELGNLDQLWGLYLGSTHLSGPIPPELGNLEQLRYLSLYRNSLSGPIPPELGNLGQLKELALSGNSLSGPIPPELGNLEQLEWLWLADNSLSGPIPPELGNLEQLQWLVLSGNSLSGPIPPELGNLGQLKELALSGNSLSGPIPPELGNLEQLRYLILSSNAFTGQLPRSLIQLDSLEIFHFDGQDLCAPADNEFQMWLNSIPNHSGPTCTALHFAGDIPDQSFPLMLPIAPMILPEAQGGISPVTYALTPTLPAGLGYDSSTRTISGTPTMVTSSPVPYTFKATDSTGKTDSLVFSIEVFGPVASEQEGLPESFTVHGNYPNPFQKSTRLVVDLPWPATLNLEVFDVIGRRVLSPPPVDLAAGWGLSIRLEGATLPSGLYMYRIQANSPVGIQRHAGRLLRVR